MGVNVFLKLQGKGGISFASLGRKWEGIVIVCMGRTLFPLLEGNSGNFCGKRIINCIWGKKEKVMEAINSQMLISYENLP